MRLRVTSAAGALFVTAPIAQAWCTRAGLFGGGPRVLAIVGVDIALLAAGLVLLGAALALVRTRTDT